MMSIVQNYSTDSPKPQLLLLDAEQLGQSIPPLADLGKRMRSMISDILAPQEIGKTAYGNSGLVQNVMEIDFARAEASMRRLAHHQGLDFDKLVQEASGHFLHEGGIIRPVELTDEDINLLTDDDDQALRE